MVTDSELIDAVRSIQRPAAFVAEVAEKIGLSSEQTRKRLWRLNGENKLRVDKVNNNTVVAWVED